MIKIFMTVRNRLAITKKAIQAIEKHTEIPYQLYIYNNQTNYKVEEHWKFFQKLYSQGRVTQVTFNTDESTFNAFSKAVSFNAWGLQHEMDPKKDEYDFILCLDSDIIVLPKYDLRLKVAWEYVNKRKMKNIKVIGSRPAGIKHIQSSVDIIPGKLKGDLGFLGGSGAWSFRPNFFTDVGFLSIPQLVGKSKQHDQQYWRLMSQASGNQPYIMGLKPKLFLHVGCRCGSVCNVLTKTTSLPKQKRLESIKFEHQEKMIEAMTFDEFYKSCVEDDKLVREW